jgi:hypothetical protein
VHGRAVDIAAFLRMDAGNPTTTALVAELAEFREIWSEHAVKDKRHGTYRFCL